MKPYRLYVSTMPGANATIPVSQAMAESWRLVAEFRKLDLAKRHAEKLFEEFEGPVTARIYDAGGRLMHEKEKE